MLMNKLTIENGVVTSCSEDAEDISIPYGVTKIGDYAFECCATLKSVTIPDSVTEIGEEAFCDCTSLRSISIPYSVRKVGYYAFGECASLQNVIIYESMTEIGPAAFYECKSLKSITVPKNLTQIEEKCFFGCSSLKSITIPNGVSKIGREAFANCAQLNHITIPDNVIIEKKAFKGCKKLVDDNGLVIINGILFDYLGDQESLCIPDNVNNIEQDAFDENSTVGKLKRISAPDSIAVVDEEAFIGKNNIMDFVLRVSFPAGGEISFGSDRKRWIKALTEMRIDADTDYIRAVDEGYLTKKQIRKIALCRITDIDNAPSKAEYDYYLEIVKKNRSNLLEEAVFNKDVNMLVAMNDIGTIDIKSVSKLIDKIVEKGDTELSVFVLDFGEQLFGYNRIESYNERKEEQSLKRLTTTVEEFRKLWRFRDNGDGTLTVYEYKGTDEDIYIPAMIGKKAVTHVEKRERGERDWEEPAFAPNAKLKTVEFAQGIQSIGYKTFCGCRSLKKVILPNGFAQIGDSAFEACTSLERIIFPSSLKEIGYRAFERCTSLREVAIPEGVDYIGHSTFSGCKSLQSIALPSSISIIDTYTFMGCSSLSEVVLSVGLKDIRTGAFKGCSSLTEIKIPESVEYIRDIVFEDCSSLRSIVVLGNVQDIAWDAFKGCKQLADREGVVTIGGKQYNCLGDDIRSFLMW